MSKFCDACGEKPGMIGMGGALLCRTCAKDVRVEMDALRAQGKQVNVMGIARRIYRETHSAGNYILRDIPEELKTKAQHAALDAGTSLREWILEAMREKLDRRSAGK